MQLIEGKARDSNQRASEGKLILDDIMKVVTEIRNTHKNCEKSYNDACVSLEKQIKENSDALKAQNEQNLRLTLLIETDD